MIECNDYCRISTPGRICLFGEHQDYLHLPIIASAISKRVYIQGKKRNDGLVNIDLPDIGNNESFSLLNGIKYSLERDYFKSSINVLKREGFSFSQGWDCTVHGEIPINAGTSSSSALVVAWINYLSRMSDQAVKLSPEKIAEFAYKAEVLEFSEPGGMMDQYSTSVGGIIGLSSFPEIKVEKIEADLGAFVLGNSLEPKDTKFILSRVKNRIIAVTKELAKRYEGFSLQTIRLEELPKFKDSISQDEYQILEGTVINRDITREAEKLLTEKNIDHKKVGELLNEHHAILRDVLKISTPKIDSMIKAALDAGAYGAKINGSGGGGCMFAYAPENTEGVLNAVKEITDEAYIVKIDNGTISEKPVGIN